VGLLSASNPDRIEARASGLFLCAQRSVAGRFFTSIKLENDTMTDEELDRPIWGAKNIGKPMNLKPRQTYHLLEQGHLPATKVWQTWVSTLRKLRARIDGK
jgi:hypothetical protein